MGGSFKPNSHSDSLLISRYEHEVIRSKGVKGSARQGWIVDSAPANLQNGPTNGTPQSIKLSLGSQSRHLDFNQKGGCEERMLRRSQTGQA